jgi:hypothetical protein
VLSSKARLRRPLQEQQQQLPLEAAPPLSAQHNSRQNKQHPKQQQMMTQQQRMQQPLQLQRQMHRRHSLHARSLLLRLTGL